MTGAPPRPPRVTHVTASYWPDSGGIARYVHALATAPFAAQAAVLTVAPDGRARREVVDGLPVVRVARQAVVHSAPTGLVPLGLAAHLRRASTGSGLIHAHLPFPALLGLAPAAHRHAPWVLTYHNEIQAALPIPAPVRRVHNLLLRRLLARARAIVVTTADYAAACPSLAGVQAKIRPVPYGIAADAFAAGGAGAPLRRADDLLLYVGRLAYYKGIDVLLRALAAVPEARLVVAGAGPEASILRCLAADLGLAGRVTWRGAVPDADLVDLYHTATALVLPSTGLSESFGIVQLEAQACGTPVISSALPGVRVVNPAGVTGLQARPGDPAALAQAIRHLLADADLRARLGAQAHAHVRRHYTMPQMLAGLAAVYAECGVRRPATAATGLHTQ